MGAARRLAQFLGGLALALPLAAQAVVVVVPGTSDPWLAGMPDGSTASAGDVAPAQSPVLVTGITLVPGTPLMFVDATGGVVHTPGCPPSCYPIDGSGMISHATGAENGIATVTGPLNALAGVFLDDSQPDSSPAPAGLDFSSIGLDFTTLAPELKQPFFIGDGMTSGGVVQTFVIPTGATRLYLGTIDGFGWYNNSGAITVDVVAIPEPDVTALLLMGLAGMAVVMRRRPPSL